MLTQQISEMQGKFGSEMKDMMTSLTNLQSKTGKLTKNLPSHL
jgi:hypothetical protein